MSSILIPVLIVSVIGLILGLALAVASIVMAVPVDTKAEAIRECLPGANCGACGFSGCDGYAAALSKGITKNTALCSPGGNDVSKQIAEIAGLDAGNVAPSAAVVTCQGFCEKANTKMIYNGVESCQMAKQLFGGPKDCIYGCIGLGDCVKACPYEAIHICDGVARVNPAMCKACKMCVKTCPNSLIKMMPLHEAKAVVLCANKDKGAVTRKECELGCIGCMKCVKACEFDAVKVENFCAKVNFTKCTGCGKCTEVCPVKCINLITLED
jgi:RnfABCDGE-type electron transport complex B subunit